jgi:hypothetical protein
MFSLHALVAQIKEGRKKQNSIEVLALDGGGGSKKS